MHLLAPLKQLNAIADVAAVFKAVEADRLAVQEKVAGEMESLLVLRIVAPSERTNVTVSKTARVSRPISISCKRSACVSTCSAGTSSKLALERRYSSGVRTHADSKDTHHRAVPAATASGIPTDLPLDR